MNKLTELKAQAYDILASMEQLNKQMEQFKEQLVYVNQQIGEEYAAQQNAAAEPVLTDEPAPSEENG